jgi:ComF family protein
MPMPESTIHNLCGACLTEPPHFDRAESALVYDHFSRKLVLSLKNQDKTFMLNVIAKLLFAAGQDILADTQALVPVPLHWHKQWLRQFNQSALMAQYLSKFTHIPVLHALKRSRSTPSQGGLSSLERQKNVRGAFQGTMPSLHLNHCTLIDDVLTTGSTLNECAQLLKTLGVKKVSVLTLCRTINSGKKYVRN